MSRSMLTFKQFLLEAAPPEYKQAGKELMAFVSDRFPVTQIASATGTEFDKTGFYQIRFAPADRADVSTLVPDLVKLMKSPEGKKFGFKDIVENTFTGNSGTFKGTTFTYKGMQFEYILARGKNEGEHFEDDLYKALDAYISKGKESDLATKAFEALEKVDEAYAAENIESVRQRSGSTKRSKAAPEDVAKIIADIILTTTDGDEVYLSVKDPSGATLGQFGLEDTFNDDYSVNQTQLFKEYLAPFNLDFDKIQKGFKNRNLGKDTPGSIVLNPKVNTVKMKALLARLWGSGYIYMRYKGGKFIAFDISEDFVKNQLIGNIKVTEIRYPSLERKQVTILMENSTTKYKVDIRNAKRGDVPAQIQLIMSKTSLF